VIAPDCETTGRTTVDVVVVSYNSRDELRECVDPFLANPDTNVIVVDNASPDRSLDAVRDLPVTAIQLPRNDGFATGVNAGWRAGSSPYVLILNPDAQIDDASLLTLARVLDEEPQVGAAAPRIHHEDGSLDYSQRLFPRLRSTYAQALFLHRVFPRATWTDELVRDDEAYARRGAPDWVSGACILVRRDVLAELGGLDEAFFMYCEDIDLCRRLRSSGYQLVFEPTASVLHLGGASAPRAGLLPALAASRVRYARKHRGRVVAFLERVGVGLGAATHALVGRGGRAMRAGHARALIAAARPVATSHPARVEPPL
jgi:N-acetylglucosaminyl-diphospho-decaprenol L-rhamnosyltransferase